MHTSQNAFCSEHDPATVKDQPRKAYERPTIIYEASLEVRAGSPLSIPSISPDDLFGKNVD
jgi:hypothetical protein